MIDGVTVIRARKAGEIRYCVANECSANMDRVLAKFGLTASAGELNECTREHALWILTQLLWKDMAYQTECMPEPKAAEMARQIVSQYECPTSKYFSNGLWHEEVCIGGTPFTESTFDAGLIITGADHLFFCIWFQDED